MKAAYIYCSHCGYESFENTDVSLGGNYSNGLFVLCPECSEETSEFAEHIEEDTEIETEEVCC